MATILLVEDDFNLRDVFRMALEHAGYRTLHTDSAVMALSIAQDEHPDLLVADLVLPDLHGIALAAIIRADPRTAHTPLIAISSTDLNESEVVAAGFNAFYRKPVSPTQLIEAVARLLHGPELVL
jgi:CheY-like chemotaxis protein